MSYTYDPFYYPVTFNPDIDASPIVGCDRWTSNSVERIFPGYDNDDSSQDFMILFFPTPGYHGSPPPEGPELAIEVTPTVAILTWTGPPDATWRVYSDTIPYFLPAAETFLAEVVGTNAFYLPVTEAQRYFQVTQVLE